MLRPPVIPDMEHDLVEISQDMKIIEELEDSPSGEILHSVPFHLPTFYWLVPVHTHHCWTVHTHPRLKHKDKSTGIEKKTISG